MKRTGLWIAAFAFATASMAKEYAPPANVPLATLVVKNLTSGYAVPATFDNPKKCTGMRKLPKGNMWVGKPPALAPQDTLSVSIEAAREFTMFLELTQSSGGGVSSCRVIQAFTPEEGVTYVATVRASSEACSVLIERETKAADGSLQRAEQLTRRRELPAITFGPSPQCKEEAVQP